MAEDKTEGMYFEDLFLKKLLTDREAVAEKSREYHNSAIKLYGNLFALLSKRQRTGLDIRNYNNNYWMKITEFVSQTEIRVEHWGSGDVDIVNLNNSKTEEVLNIVDYIIKYILKIK